jgi:hypothetical protein
MKTKHKLYKILLTITIVNTLATAKASAVANDSDKSKVIASSIYTASFSERNKPRALDLYWHKMAECETGGNWNDTGKWSGGLGIYTQTWVGYGGLEFAKKPELATIEEQIIVANRISTQGYQTKNEFLTLQDKQTNRPYFREPVGFGGWGCKRHVGKPALFKKFPSKTLFKEYKLGDRNKYVYTLQKILGVGVDGYYGPVTDRAYNRFIVKYMDVIVSEYQRYLTKSASPQ